MNNFLMGFVIFCLKFVDSSFVPPLVYALMGSSRDLAVGTVAVAFDWALDQPSSQHWF